MGRRERIGFQIVGVVATALGGLGLASGTGLMNSGTSEINQARTDFNTAVSAGDTKGALLAIDRKTEGIGDRTLGGDIFVASALDALLGATVTIRARRNL
jgi:hypothetical protein